MTHVKMDLDANMKIVSQIVRIIMKIMILISLFLLFSISASEELYVSAKEKLVSEEQMVHIGTYMKIGTCIRFSFEESVMLVCRERRRIYTDLWFKDWFDFSEVNK